MDFNLEKYVINYFQKKTCDLSRNILHQKNYKKMSNYLRFNLLIWEYIPSEKKIAYRNTWMSNHYLFIIYKIPHIFVLYIHAEETFMAKIKLLSKMSNRFID